MSKKREKQQFILRHFTRAFAILIVIIIFFVIGKREVDPTTIDLLDPLLHNNWLVIGFFMLSEVIFGIIPPEFFFIWALQWEEPTSYFGIITLLV